MFYIHLAQHQAPPLTTAVFGRLNTDIVWRKHSYIAKPISANISLLVHDLLLIYLILLCQKYEKKKCVWLVYIFKITFATKVYFIRLPFVSRVREILLPVGVVAKTIMSPIFLNPASFEVWTQSISWETGGHYLMVENSIENSIFSLCAAYFDFFD